MLFITQTNINKFKKSSTYILNIAYLRKKTRIRKKTRKRENEKTRKTRKRESDKMIKRENDKTIKRENEKTRKREIEKAKIKQNNQTIFSISNSSQLLNSLNRKNLHHLLQIAHIQ